jgi:transposase
MGRKRWSVEEKRRIVELTVLPGASVARVAQAEGVNANQVFLWRRAYRNGEMLLGDSTALLAVVIEAERTASADITSDPEVGQGAREGSFVVAPSGAIHIDLPGRATISVERGADRGLLRTILESLCGDRTSSGHTHLAGGRRH